MTGRRTDAYQPSRAVQDYDPLDGEDTDLPAHRLPRFVVGSLLGVAALATLVWFAYERGLSRGNGEVIVIGPPPGPMRMRPDDPGGTPQLYSGLEVYQRPQAPEIEAEASHLSPASSAETGLATANPTSGAATRAQPAPANTAPKGVEPFYLQIGAYPTRDLAEKAFHQFQTAHGDLAGDLPPDIKTADLGTKGVWYRLRIGPFAGKAAAAQSCEKMTKKGVSCLIAGR
jgi:cell division septation protein DedD